MVIIMVIPSPVTDVAIITEGLEESMMPVFVTILDAVSIFDEEKMLDAVVLLAIVDVVADFAVLLLNVTSIAVMHSQ